MPEPAELESVAESEHSHSALAARAPGTGDASLAIPGMDGGSLGAPVLQRQVNAGVRAIATRQAQRTFGNRFAQRALSQPAVQRSCACGGTCEKCSQEAALPVSGEMELVQPQSHGGPSSADRASLDRLKPAASASEPLRPDIRRSMESYFGSDLGNVRVHSGSAAAFAADSIHADAYTIGSDIYFAAGKYQPESREGRKLLAHEITHVRQQAEGRTPTHSLPLRSGDVVIGAPEDSLEQEANRNAEAFGREPVSSPVAEVSGQTTASMAQRDTGDKGHEGETVEDFKGRVMNRAIDRLDRNIRALDEWRVFIAGLKGFQLRQQRMTSELSDYAMVASQQVGGPERFETMVGTHSAGERAYQESKLAVDATPLEVGLGYVGHMSQLALGFDTDPSIAERMMIEQGKKTKEDLPRSVHVGPAPGYEFYAPVLQHFELGKSGCQFCHDMNQARQRTIEVHGSAEPKGPKFHDFGPLVSSGMYPMAGNQPNFAEKASDDLEVIARARGWVDSVTSTQNAPQESGPPGDAATRQAKADPRSFLGDLKLPDNVETPIPRSNLCGELPPAQAGADYLADASEWGENSAAVVDAIRTIGAVLQPLGPFGYRILPRQTFDQLWSAGPVQLEAMRGEILQNLATRQDNYRTLQMKIRLDQVPYDELCPIVDELLPTTNPMVRAQVQFDIAMKRAQDAVLDGILKIVGAALLLLAIFFPPSIMLSGPVIAAGVGVSLVGIAVGARDYRRGRQTALSVGSHLHSRAEEDAADSLAFWGIVNMVTSLIGLWQFRSMSVAAAEAKSGAAVLEDVHPTGVPEKVLEGPGAPRDLPGEGGPKVVPDADTTAKPGDFTPEQMETANNKLAERINNPEKVREVSDPDLAKDYDLEVELDDGQIYRRKKGGKWCLFRNPKLCGVEPGPVVEQAANTQKSLLQAEAKAEAEVGPGTQLAKLRDGFKKMVANDSNLQKLGPAKQAKLLASLEERLISRALDRFPPGYITDEEAMRAYLRKNPEKLDEMLDADLAWNDTGNDPAAWEAQVQGRHAKKLAEAEQLVSGENKFFDPQIEERYQDYLKSKASVKKTPRERADWKVASDAAAIDSPWARGNQFNKVRSSHYPYNEVHLENGYRLDSYNPAEGEIVSRKDTDFDLIGEDSFNKYLKELKSKYPPGTRINSPKYSKPGVNPAIDGQVLKGKQILEVPLSNQNAANRTAFEAAAKAQGIEIRYANEMGE